MERTPEQTLKLLALYHNEPLLYKQYPLWKQDISNDVSIHVIEIKPLGSTFDNQYEVVIRVSCLRNQSPTMTGCYVSEIKWEGKLQDWYAACAQVVEETTSKLNYEPVEVANNG